MKRQQAPDKKRERRIRDITFLAKKGFTREEIAEKLGLTYNNVSTYVARYEIPVTRKNGRENINTDTPEFEIEVVKAARDTKKLDLTDILDYLGISYSKAISERLQEILSDNEMYCRNMNIKPIDYIPSVWLLDERGLEGALNRTSCDEEYEATKRQVLEAAINYGFISLVQIARATGLTKQSVEDVLILEDGLGVEIPRRKRRPVLDRYIKQGLKLEDISTKDDVKVTRERVRQYILCTGQHAYWEERKRVKKVKEKEHVRLTKQVNQALATQIASHVDNMANELGEEYALALRACRGYTKKSAIKSSWNNVETFADIFRLHLKGQTPAEIAKEVGTGREHKVNITYIDYVIRRLAEIKPNVKQRRGNRKYMHGNPLPIRQAVINAHQYISKGETAYFTQTSVEYVTDVWKDRGFTRVIANENLKLASQIYEAQDLGFTLEESLELFGRKLEEKRIQIAQKVLDNRSQLEPRIIKILTEMYPDRSFIRPYIGHRLYK